MLTIPSPEPKLGQVFTRRWVAETLLDLAGYGVHQPLERMRIVEPAVGEGAFLAPILQRLLDRALGCGVPLADLADAICAYDLDAEKVAASRLIARESLLLAGASETLAEELATHWVRCDDYLLSPATPADIVVGNPPYIRYDDLGAELFVLYQSKWPTLSGRGDIYVAFWEKALASLKSGGVVAYICADRWMRNSYGRRLRELVGERFGVRDVWTMHDVDAFHSKVASYPAITVIANEPQGRVAVADTTAEFGATSAQELAHWSRTRRTRAQSGRGYRAHRLSHWFTGPDLWPTGPPTRLALLEQLSGLPTIEQAGVKVGIGLASGADAVYVVENAPVEPDRMLPMATRNSITPKGLHWAGEHLVNPWGSDGSLVQLASFPKLESYLRSSIGVTERQVAQKNPKSWHRTIDRVVPGLAEKTKLLIPDMRQHVQPYLDDQGLYPHHNFYWMTSDVWDLRVLGGLLLSDTAQSFIEAYCVRMRGGTLRLQAQYLRTIRVPRFEDIPADVEQELRTAFASRDRARASAAARVAYKLTSNA